MFQTKLGVHLLADINECDSFPCQNGGRCTDKVFGYECGPCPFGFTGFNCERGPMRNFLSWQT